MFGIAENVRNLLKMNMEQWNLLLASNGEDLEVVNVKRGIFQGDSLTPHYCLFGVWYHCH